MEFNQRRLQRAQFIRVHRVLIPCLGHNGQRCRFRSRPEQEGPDAKANPTECLRYELCRASVARAVDASARSCRSLQHARLLGRTGKAPRARQVRRAVPGRCARRLRRVPRIARRGDCERGAGASQRSAIADPSDGVRHAQSGLRSHLRGLVRTPVHAGPPVFDARSSDRRAYRLECGHRISQQRRQGHRACATTGA
jgi:hypothetical protein